MKLVITGGGTGGHIYPAIAIADKIKRKRPDSQILFVGTRKGMESRLVPERGYEIYYIPARGFDRKNIFNNIKTIFDLVKGCRQAGEIIGKYRPDMVIGTGGYVSVPVLWAAGRKGIPVYIHEQNAFPGLANRMLSRYAEKIFISFPESKKYFKHKEKTLFTGNPIRKEFLLSGIVDYREKLGIKPGEFFLLSFGGSGGAQKINESILKLAEEIDKKAGIKLLHVTGNYYYDNFVNELKRKALDNNENIRVVPYSHKIHEYMLAADLLISRAGAITVAELTACGKPAILIPSPNVTANHQYYNAKAVADRGGAILLEEKDLTFEKLKGIVFKLAHNKEALNTMGEASLSLGRVDGADGIFSGLGL